MKKQQQLQEMSAGLAKQGILISDTHESSMSVSLETGFTNTYTEVARIEKTDKGYILRIETTFKPMPLTAVANILLGRISENIS